MRKSVMTRTEMSVNYYEGDEPTAVTGLWLKWSMAIIGETRLKIKDDIQNAQSLLRTNLSRTT